METNTTQNRLTLEQKIGAIQQEIDGIVKEASNPFFKSKYVHINDIIDDLRPMEKQYGISVRTPLTSLDGKPALKLVVSNLDVDLGESEAIEEITPLPDLQDPQKMGSAVTYYRRYMLMSFFNLKAEDDDGNSTQATKPVITTNKPTGSRL